MLLKVEILLHFYLYYTIWSNKWNNEIVGTTNTTKWEDIWANCAIISSSDNHIENNVMSFNLFFQRYLKNWNRDMSPINLFSLKIKIKYNDCIHSKGKGKMSISGNDSLCFFYTSNWILFQNQIILYKRACLVNTDINIWTICQIVRNS